MQSTIEEAIQRLYRACEQAGCFPGVLPDQHDGVVTVESILRGLGLDRPDPPSRPPLRPHLQHDGQGRPTTSTAHRPVDDLTETLLQLAYPRSSEHSSDAMSERSSQSPMRRTSASQPVHGAFPLSRTASSSLSTAPMDRREESRLQSPQVQQWPPETQAQNGATMHRALQNYYKTGGMTMQPGSLQYFMAPHRQYHVAANDTIQLQSPTPMMADQIAQMGYPQPIYYDSSHIHAGPMSAVSETWPLYVGDEDSFNMTQNPDMRNGIFLHDWHGRQ